MKQSKEQLTRDLAEFQGLIGQLDPSSPNPDDQVAIKIFTYLVQQRKHALSVLGETVCTPCNQAAEPVTRKEEVLWANA